MASSQLKHLLHCSAFFTLVLFLEFQFSGFGHPFDLGTFSNYHPLVTLLVYFLQLLPVLALPHTISIAAGLLFYNAFEDEVRLEGSPQLAPFLCFRVVTRGNYPALVKANVERNRAICLEAGLQHFMLEVVTDRQIGVPSSAYCREVVVPEGYRTKSGALYKARALQYCLEDGVNCLRDDDWIVHLDEETILTRRSVHGILNFVGTKRHQFGQGLITYANEKIVNWITTLADTYRVADDMGRIRCELSALHCPISGWKGSYIVALAGAERKVTFDHGIDGSIAEDAFFGMVATMHGYSFDYIEGEMWEKSPFTIWDFIRQRKRWLQGNYLLVHSPLISIRTKFVIMVNFYAWITTPLSLVNLVTRNVFPLQGLWMMDMVSLFILGTTIYMYIFGIFKSFSIVKFGLPKFVLCLIGVLLALPCNVLMENMAVILGLFGRKHNFYIVDKTETKPVIYV